MAKQRVFNRAGGVSGGGRSRGHVGGQLILTVSDGPTVNEITREWLDVFDECVGRGEILRDSSFWRLALYTLPNGVDPNHPSVIDALILIRESVAAGGRAGRDPV